MTKATLLCGLLFGVCAQAQKNTTPVLACNPKAISAADRPRYNELMKRLRAAVRDHSEIADGYSFKLDGKAMTLPEAAEWISMERLCCQFLTFQLSVSGNQEYWVLKL